MDPSFIIYAKFIEKTDFMVNFSFMVVEIIQLLKTVIDQ